MRFNPFPIPGYGQSKKIDEIFQKPFLGGGAGGASARRHADEKAKQELEKEFEAYHEEEARKERSEEPARNRHVVEISNAKWSHDQGRFNGKITAKVDVHLPETHKHLTRITFTLLAMEKAGEKSRIDSKEAHARNGSAEAELTLYRPAQRDATGVDEKRHYFFVAKHRDSKEHASEKLPVTEEESIITLEEAQAIAFEITKQYEAGGSYATLSGNFDGAGLSFGSMQWNVRWGTLQELLTLFKKSDEAAFTKCFGDDESALARIISVMEEKQKPVDHIRGEAQNPFPEGMDWAASTQEHPHDKPFRWKDNWDVHFKNLGAIPGFQKIQREHSIRVNHGKAMGKVQWLKDKAPGLWGKVYLRSYCALFDLANQHGLASESAKSGFEKDISGQPPKTQREMVERFSINVAKHPGTKWERNSIGRREGILNGGPKAGRDCDWVNNSRLKKYLHPDKIIRGL